MPDGVTHFEIGVIGGLTAVLAAVLYTDPPTARALAIGTAVGLLVTPDLDQEGKTFTEAVLRRIPGLGFLFQVSWYPYALLFRHRGWSHHIIVGTPTRIAWTLLLLAFWSAVCIGLGWLWSGFPRDWWHDISLVVLREANPVILLAWWWQDALHVTADVLVSEIKTAF